VNSAKDAGAKAKVLLLNRPFLNLVNSHKNWDNGVKDHARVIGKYSRHICDELMRINDDDIWIPIEYDWFAREHCPKAVLLLTKFLEWPAVDDPETFCNSTDFHISSKVVKLTPSDILWIKHYALTERESNRWWCFENVTL